MKRFKLFLKKCMLTTIMASCLFATYIVVKDNKGESVNADATQFLEDIKPHINYYAKLATGNLKEGK